MAELNAAQRVHVRAVLGRVDALLRDAEALLATPQAGSAFSRHAPDATPVLRKLVADRAATIRARMSAALVAFDALPAPPATGATSAARVTMLFAQTALADLAPARMRGYGAVDESVARELNGVCSELFGELQLLEGQLARSQRRGGECASGAGRGLLEALRRAIANHDLAEARAPLQIVAEKMDSDMLEVGIFGRSGAGKSSLLNFLTQSDALPAHATPTTAVPVRIIHGPRPWGHARFADALAESFPLGRLAEFASQRYNSDNTRHAVELEIELPADILKPGTALWDTPGLGSLAPGCTEAALACLVRCDIGILAVDAAGAVSQDELSLLHALQLAGASVLVVLTRADLLDADERQRKLEYVARELRSSGAEDFEIDPVSVRRDSVLCSQWLERSLQPLLREHVALRRKSLARKLEGLRDAVYTALEGRIAALSAPADVSSERSPAWAERLSAAAAELDTVARFGRAQDPTGKLERLLSDVAHNAVVLWRHGEPADTDASCLVAAALKGVCGAAASDATCGLNALRAGLAAALAEAARACRIACLSGELPAIGIAPALAWHARRIPLRRPRLALWPRLARRSVRGQLELSGIPEAIRDALRDYQREHEIWRQQELANLRAAFSALRAEILVRGGSSAQAGLHRAALRADLADIERLGALNAGPAPRPGEPGAQPARSPADAREGVTP